MESMETMEKNLENGFLLAPHELHGQSSFFMFFMRFMVNAF